MFEDKKEAESHDKMLELAEGITFMLRENISGIDEKISHEVGVLLAKRRDDLVKACKGKPEVLMIESEKETESGTETRENVAPLVANQ
jgi:dsDNA-binding SOS-regulon protein